ncbi:hypothetical protein CMUST_07045 [Corynebacterium mustelae]|uniref:DUF4862 family protein n=1 Tax=Corynebacterium mustelae TaxID=571915 RepID=A0A0G3H1Q9_9CORY|nr:DUF4862 family protein [Corynebacterium mustelae]AKK05743.1 hypothetical protein CMUST_07045 [Corynebacterium mustelae]
MTTRSFLVGAYASMPTNLAEQERYYELLAGQEWITGLEIPYPGQLADPQTRNWLSPHIAKFPDSIITAIPGTMVNVWADDIFGLASPSEQGRARALAFTKEIYQIATTLNVSTIAVHSAPTAHCDAATFEESMKEILKWGDKTIIIEHCDSATPHHTPEKGFLSLEEELAVAEKVGVQVSINWGRSAIDGRSEHTPIEHITAAQNRGLLAGVIFSGASDRETSYGPAWGDGHLPSSIHEPASLLNPTAISAAAKTAGEISFLGAKVCVPPTATLEDRLAMLRVIYDAT